MLPYIWTIDFVVGTNEDWRDILTLYEPWDGASDGEAPPAEHDTLDLTAATFAMHLRRAPGDTTAALILSSANSRLGLSGTPTDGRLIWNVDKTVMSKIAPGIYVHDITMAQGGVDRVVARGTVEIVLGVTP